MSENTYFIRHGKNKIISDDNKKKLDSIVNALNHSWGSDTSVWGDEIPRNNLARGQCVVSSLVVQDYFGGDLVRVKVDGDGIDEKHYLNQLEDGTVIDTTGKQYGNREISLTPARVDLAGRYESMRERLLDDNDTARRYELLKSRVSKRIAEYNKQIVEKRD